MRRPSPAFTLIEVMAAVVIFALVVAFLSSTATQWSRLEGDSRRRAQASLLADSRLAELEAEAARGAAPALGKREKTEGIFRETSEVRPLQLAALGLGEAADAKGDAQSAGGLLAAAGEATPPLLELLVAVAWDEGASEASVERTTFVVNPAALAALASAAPADQAKP